MARAKDPGGPPKEKMPMLRYTIAVLIAMFLDAAKFVFVFIVFTGPAIAGAVATATSGSTAGWLAGLGVAGLSFIPGVAGVEEFFGIVAALLISFVGWIGYLGWFFVSGIKLVDTSIKKLGALIIGFIVSEVPLMDAFPSFTPSIWYICHNERKDYQVAYAKWKKEKDAFDQAQIQERQAYIQHVQAQQAAQMQEQAANDNEEIPEELARAA